MRRKLVTLLALSLALPLLLSAVVSAKTTLRVLAHPSQWYVPYLKERIKEFNSQRKDVEAVLETTPGLKERILTETAGGVASDVLFLGNVSDQVWRDVFAQQLTLDLKPYLDKDKDFDVKDFYPSLARAFTYRGRFVGVPLEVSTSATYINRVLLDKAGIDEPDDNWEWDDLLRMGRKLTVDTNGDGTPDQWAFGADGYSLIYLGATSFLWANGGDVVNEQQTQATLNKPEAMDALQFFYDIHFKDKIAVPMTEYQHLLFWKGKVAIWESASWNIAYNRQHADKGVEWDIVPQLTSPRTKKAAAMTVGHVAAVHAASKNPQLAWEFIKFVVLSDEGQKRIAQAGMLPSRMSLAKYYASIMKRPPSSPKNLIKSAGVGRTAVWFNDPRKHKEIWTLVDKEWAKVASQKTSVASFVQLVTPRINDILKR